MHIKPKPNQNDTPPPPQLSIAKVMTDSCSFLRKEWK